MANIEFDIENLDDGVGGEDLYEELSDSLSISDSRKSNVGTKLTAGPLAIDDSLAKAATFRKSLGESLSVGDGTGHTVGFKRSIDDSVSIADGLDKTACFSLQDLVNISDALKKTFKTSFSDTLSISDILSTGILQESLSDTLNISDLLELKKKISRGEQLSISDQVLVARVFYLADTLSISDSLTHQFIVAGGLTDLLQTPALIVTKCYAIADDVPAAEKLRVWARARDGKEKVIYIDPA